MKQEYCLGLFDNQCDALAILLLRKGASLYVTNYCWSSTTDSLVVAWLTALLLYLYDDVAVGFTERLIQASSMSLYPFKFVVSPRKTEDTTLLGDLRP